MGRETSKLGGSIYIARCAQLRIDQAALIERSRRARRVRERARCPSCSQSPHDEAVVVRCAQWKPTSRLAEDGRGQGKCGARERRRRSIGNTNSNGASTGVAGAPDLKIVSNPAGMIARSADEGKRLGSARLADFMGHATASRVQTPAGC